MLADRVRELLERAPSILSSETAALVAPIGWRRLAAVGIGEDDYATAPVVVGGTREAGRGTPRRSPLPGFDRLRLEHLGNPPPSKYVSLGLRDSTACAERLAAALRGGLDLARRVPAAAETLGLLVRSIHPLAVEDPAIDVSYSDPEVPFSIFVGVHDTVVANEGLRTAEAIVHETMHLQLSLIEDAVPLVAGAEQRWHSPWQRRPRPAQGVLHGLYVFRAISEFLQRLPSATLDADGRRHVEGRMRDISTEMSAAADVLLSEELTAAGRRLAERLLDEPREQRRQA